MTSSPSQSRTMQDPVGTPIKEIIPGILKSWGLEARYWFDQLNNDWPGIVGDPIAKNPRPGRMTGKTLIVFVSPSTWLNELSRYGQKEILAKLREKYGPKKITGLRFQLDPGTGRS